MSKRLLASCALLFFSLLIAQKTVAQTSEKDDHPLFHHSSAKSHTIVVSFSTAPDPPTRDTVRKGVERVLAEPSGELWARASDAQVAELRRRGFIVAYRDGVDLVRCVDVRSSPGAASRPPPAPFRDSGTPHAYLIQLTLPTHAIDSLQDQLSMRNAILLETPEPATIIVSASPAVAARLAKLPFVSWMGAYGARERLVPLAYSVVELQPGCSAGPDAPLKALGAWIKRAPQAKLKLSAILFKKSAEWKALVRSLGGRIDGTDSDGDGEIVHLTVPRSALPEVAAHPALRVLELHAEAAL